MKSPTRKAKGQIKILIRSRTLEDGNLLTFPVLELDGIQAVKSHWIDDNETGQRIRFIVPADYPASRIEDAFVRLRKRLGDFPANPQQTLRDMALDRRARRLVEMGHISPESYAQKGNRTGYAWTKQYNEPPSELSDPTATVSVAKLADRRKSLLVSVKAKRSRNKAPSVSLAVHKAIREEYATTKNPGVGQRARLEALKLWYDDQVNPIPPKRRTLKGPPLQGTRLKRLATTKPKPR